MRLLESGVSPRTVCQQLGVGHSALWLWTQEYGSEAYLRMRRPRFSPAQRAQIVRDVLAGRLTEDEVVLKYGLRSRYTVREWLAAAARAAPPPPPVAEEPAAPAGGEAELRGQLQQAQQEIEALHLLIDQAEATYKIEIRKKAGAKQST